MGDGSLHQATWTSIKRIRPTIVVAVVFVVFGVGCVGLRPHTAADWEALRRQQQEEAHEKQEKDIRSEKSDAWTCLYYLASGLASAFGR